MCECSEIVGSPQGSPPAADYVSSEARRRTCSEHETRTEELCQSKLDYHIVDDGLVTVRDKARLRQGHIDQSHQGHQCSETMLTGESLFHICNPLGIEPGSLMKGIKQVDHWTSGTVCEFSEIAGSPHFKLNLMKSLRQSLYFAITV